MLLDPVAWLFIYLLIGALVWMLCEPATCLNFAISRYCARNGRLPSAGFMVIAIAVVIVLWPRLALAQLRRLRS